MPHVREDGLASNTRRAVISCDCRPSQAAEIQRFTEPSSRVGSRRDAVLLASFSGSSWPQMSRRGPNVRIIYAA